MEHRVLDSGFVRLVQTMGDDTDIARAARVSHGKHNDEQKGVRRLIRYLMRNGHTSPFEMVEFKFHIKTPIFVARQWMRHRTASVNEISGRYTVLPDEAYVPDTIRVQDADNKQSSDGRHPESAKIIGAIAREIGRSRGAYDALIWRGVPREQARIVLPLAQYTEFYWKQDLHNLFHFLKLRMSDHAQYEIRMYAEAIAEMVKRVVPIAYEAWEDYVLQSRRMSRFSVSVLNALDHSQDWVDLVLPHVAHALQISKPMSKGELVDFLGELNLKLDDLHQVRDIIPDWVCKIMDS